MKRYILLLAAFLFCLQTLTGQQANRQFTIETTVGTMRGVLYADVPNHVKSFAERANRGDYNGTLFTRVIKEFMIQGGAADSRTASPGVRVGSGDRSAEIPAEMRPQYYHKKGILAAPRQNDDVNPQRKSDMSQFFIVHGKMYRPGELDTLERATNQPIRRKAMAEFYQPVKELLDSLKTSDPQTYNVMVTEINQKVDSVVRSTPGHLLFTSEQREAYTTIGGCHHLDGQYTIYGEVTEGLDLIDRIANQPKDQYDRPKQDIRITRITVK